jgi:prephenate dehydrogenase
MKKPVLAVIGFESKMNQGVVIPTFEPYVARLIGSDLKGGNMTTDEAIQIADVVMWLILPFDNIAQEWKKHLSHARPGQLWLNGSSVQRPRDNDMDGVEEELYRLGVDTGTCHLILAPSVGTVRRRPVIIGFRYPPKSWWWIQWLGDVLSEQGADIIVESALGHDQITRTIQVDPMINLLLWAMDLPHNTVALELAWRAMGGPAKLELLARLRALMNSDVVIDIFLSHRGTEEALQTLKGKVERLIEIYEAKDREALSAIFANAKSVINGEFLTELLTHSDRLGRIIEELRGDAVGFKIPAGVDVVGLLAHLLKYFDDAGLNKTITVAIKYPNGSVEIFIGVEHPESPAVQDVIQQIKAVEEKRGIELLEDPFKF